VISSSSFEWREHLVLSRDLQVAGERGEFFRRVRTGEFVAIYRGAYVRASEWEAMGRDARYLARIRAATAYAREPLIFSHESAAALWRLPSVEPWPRRVHCLSQNSAGGRSNGMFVRHTVGVPDEVATVDGLAVTTMSRTVVDLAAASAFGQAVAMADAALRRTAHPISGVPGTALGKDDLYAELELLPLRHGTARARRVIDFADGLADRPGESMSRVSMWIAQLPMPRLQVRLAGASGRGYVVDFWWPEFNLMGEFDGRDKYSNPEFLRGRTPEQALHDEKLREDDLRALDGRRMSRWSWQIALSPARMRAHLLAAGLH